MRIGAWLAAALLTGGCAHLTEEQRAASLCELAGKGDPDADAWMTLLLRGVDPRTRRVTSPALSCTGTQVRWDVPALSCEDGSLARTALPERPLAPADVVTSPTAEGATLVWIVTSRFATGEGLGPVALVDRRESLLRVVAIGSLRAFPGNARLRLERLGAHRVLVAEGEICAGTDRSTCLLAARLVPLRGALFEPDTLLGEDGACRAPAWLELSRRETRRGDGRWERLELSAVLAFGPEGLAIEELVTVSEVADRGAAQPGRALRRAQASRTIRWASGRMVVSEEPLWSRVVGRGP